MTEQADPVSKAARLIAETIILHDNEWVSFRDIVESRFGGENLDTVVEILSDHLARRAIAGASPLPQGDIEPLVARLRNLNPWQELDWPEVVNKAVERIAALENRAEGLSELLDTAHACGELIAKRAEAAEARLADALAALEPFAAFAEKAERFVQGRAVFGGDPVMPTKHFRLADFRAAADVLSRLTAPNKGETDDNA